MVMRYLIEFRFFGSARGEIKHLIWEIDRKFHLCSTHRRRHVPHITLCGPLVTNNQGRLVSDFKETCESLELIQFIVNGFSSFEHSNVVYLDIKPSKEMDEFRWEFSKKIRKYSKLQSFDYNRKFYFHSTIAIKLSDGKFKAIKEYIKNKPKPNYKHTMMRATLLKYTPMGTRILYEYDFVQRRLLNRFEAKNPHILTQSFHLLQNKLKNLKPEFESPNLFPYYLKKSIIIGVTLFVLWYIISNYVLKTFI